jgi:hypothetical protein
MLLAKLKFHFLQERKNTEKTSKEAKLAGKRERSSGGTA